jgi:hypothetical protein
VQFPAEVRDLVLARYVIAKFALICRAFKPADGGPTVEFFSSQCVLTSSGIYLSSVYRAAVFRASVRANGLTE